MTTAWTREHLAMLSKEPCPEFPVFGPEDCPPLVEGQWLWDFWPAETPDGRRAVVGGGELWFALSAPHLEDAEGRHAIARIRTLHRIGNAWRDLGPAFPDDFTPGSREWSGSTIVEDGQITLYFTAAGRRGEALATFEQRIFASSAAIDVDSGNIGDWNTPEECFASDGVIYEHAREATGTIGAIKAFRDPAWFRDPTDGAEYILFTGSVAGSPSTFSGCIGIARRESGAWQLLDPLISAEGVNNELERPHMRVRAGRYSLYWSTQSHVFANDAPTAPTGLYAMKANSVLGPYAPVASSALVVANPHAAPQQAYSWWVCGDGDVISFADRCCPKESTCFGGTLAPTFQLEV